MPGMGRSLQSGNSVIVSAFHTALLHQFFVVLILGALCAIGFNVVRTIQYRRLKGQGQSTFPSARIFSGPEPSARRILRIGFGGLWILDGLLQLQSAMPLGLPASVIEPSASTSPQWVQHLVNNGVSIWSNHPIQAASSAVWIQIGLGLWLLVAPRGRWSRLGGAASAGWALVVWVFGEAFGGILAPGATWLFGTPGAVLFYCVAGILIALPERAFATARLGRVVLSVGGLFLVGMAVLQAWPGRGFWQGRGGAVTAMVGEMSRTPQPGFLSSWLASFGSFDAAHGWAVNLFVVVALAVIGVLLLTGRQPYALAGLIGLAVLCLADWVLVEDLGFLGGVGTDPNSMLPMALLFVAGIRRGIPRPGRRGRAGDRPEGRRGLCLVATRDTFVRHPLRRRHRRDRRRDRRHRPDGDGSGQPECGPDPDRGARRHPERTEPAGSAVLAY